MGEGHIRRYRRRQKDKLEGPCFHRNVAGITFCNARYAIGDAGYAISDARYAISDAGYAISDAGRQSITGARGASAGYGRWGKWPKPARRHLAHRSGALRNRSVSVRQYS